MAGGDGITGPARGPDPDPAKCVDARPDAVCPRAGTPSWGLHPGRGATGATAIDFDRQRLGSRPDRGSATQVTGTAHPRASRVDAELGVVRGPIPRLS